MRAITDYKPELPSVFTGFEVDKTLPKEDYTFKLWQNLLIAKKQQGFLFLVIGKILKEIRDDKLYTILDYENFGDFLGSDELAFSRESAFMYIRVYEYYIGYLELNEERIQNLDVSK